MVQPRKYTRSHDFTQEDGDATNHALLNAELDAAGVSVNGLRENLALLQKDDGSLKDKIIRSEHLSDDAYRVILAGLAEAKFAAQKAANDAALAAAKATSVLTSYERYQGDSDADLVARLDGSALQVGDLYFNTTNEELCVYASAGWKTANDTYERSELYSRTEIDDKFSTGAGATGSWGIDITGTSAKAVELAKSVKIGGIDFNGSGDIDLPGVNKPSNQPLQAMDVWRAVAESGQASIGAYMMMRYGGSSTVFPNDHVQGSMLYPASASGSNTTGQSGTWRCMGLCSGAPMSSITARVTLFLRIA